MNIVFLLLLGRMGSTTIIKGKTMYKLELLNFWGLNRLKHGCNVKFWQERLPQWRSHHWHSTAATAQCSCSVLQAPPQFDGCPRGYTGGQSSLKYIQNLIFKFQNLLFLFVECAGCDSALLKPIRCNCRKVSILVMQHYVLRCVSV